jgi:hypothetical protein
VLHSTRDLTHVQHSPQQKSRGDDSPASCLRPSSPTYRDLQSIAQLPFRVKRLCAGDSTPEKPSCSDAPHFGGDSGLGGIRPRGRHPLSEVTHPPEIFRKSLRRHWTRSILRPVRLTAVIDHLYHRRAHDAGQIETCPGRKRNNQSLFQNHTSLIQVSQRHVKLK